MSRVDIRKKLEKISFNNLDTFVLSYLAFFIAFIAVATYLHLPGPSSSYFNLGEVAIYIIAISFGKKAGGISAAFGSALMDILLGYSIWAPFSFIIKGTEAWIVGSIANNKGKSWKRSILAIFIAGNFMVIAYAFTKGILIGWPAVIPEIGIDYMQMIIGGAIALPIAQSLRRYLNNGKN